MSYGNTTPIYSKNSKDREFSRTVNDKVHQYFKKKKISRVGNLELYIKTVVMMLVYLGSYFLLILYPMDILLQVLLCVLMGVGMAGVGMNVMHDGNHGSYSNRPIVNKVMGGMIYLLAGNARNWKIQHNMLHHTYTNIHGHDEDLEAGRIIRFSKYVDWIKIHKYQHIYSIFLYGALTLNWSLITDFRQTIDYYKRELFPKGYNKLWHWTKLIFFKIFYFSIWVVIPMLVMPNSWWQILIGFFIVHYTAGMILSVIFQLAHIVESTEVMKFEENTQMNNSWAAHQLFTTANFAPNNTFLNWFTGGLNHQIEHHLFPNISHVHYHKISSIVKKAAHDFGLPYYEYKSMFAALRSHFKYLKSLSKNHTLSVS